MSAPQAPRLRRTPRIVGVLPNTMYVLVDGLSAAQSRRLANQACALAYARAPKVTGASAGGLAPYWGAGFFGVRWSGAPMWYAEHGSGAHTMKSLAGRVVPMWVPDPQGQLSAENPKAKTRVTVDGRRQVLIFRRAAKLGQRKRVVRRVGGAQTHVEVPASYPGAPGRIAARSSSGAILAGNTGVRWRHPGNRGQHFISRSISAVAEAAGAGHPPVLSALQNG